MLSPRSTPPWIGYALFALALLPSIQGEAIIDSVVTPLGETATLTHSHPAFGGQLRGKVVKPVLLTEQNGKAGVRHLEAQLSDVARLEAFFGSPMETNYNVLKTSYATATADVLPWSGDYWATYRDGINVVWKDGEPSPAEKYATAFGINVASFMDGISLTTGILSEAYETPCDSNEDCEVGVCGVRESRSSGYCIPTWYGLCHAWAAAAIFENEPKCDVQKNNVTFHSVDMKALITQLYDGAAIDVVFTGARFNGPDSPEELDRYDRYTDDARRDINPAFFHIAAANILGKQHRSFIVDVSPDSQVWNQPVQKYEFLETEIWDSATLSLEYFGTEKYPFNDAAVHLAKCTTRLTWTAESIEDGALTTTGRIAAYTVYEDYEYCLELDENYTIIGGEWLGGANKDHPDFLWFPADKPTEDTVTDTGISYAEVLALIEESQQCVDVTVSPDVPDTPSTKTPGSGYTKTPNYTKTPGTKTPPTKTPPTKAPTYPPEPTTETPYTHGPEPTTETPYTYPPEPTTETPYTHGPEPTTETPYTYPPVTYKPEPTPPTTYSPETEAPETTAPPVKTPSPSLICYEDTPKPTTYAPTESPSNYPTETPVATTVEPPTYAPTETPTETPVVTYTPPTYTPTPSATYTPPTYAPTPKPTSTPKATNPAQQAGQSPIQKNSKWYRRLGEFTLWW